MRIREVIADALYRTQDLLDDDERAGHILSALDAAGQQVMPKEPTPKMIAAGHQQIDWCRNDQKTDTPDDPSQVFMTGGVRAGTYCSEDIVDAYRAMLAVEE